MSRILILRSAALTGSAALALTLSLSAPQALAKDGTAATSSTADQIAESRALAPLRDLASAIGEQGRGAYADTFSRLALDSKNNQVIVYTTDETRGREMADAAKTAHMDIDLGKVKYLSAKYAKKDLDASAAQIMKDTKPAKASDMQVYSAGAAPDGSGIQISAAASAVDQIKAKYASNTIPVTVTAGDAPQPLSWRWNDTAPQIGGDVLIGKSHKAGYTAQCTAGLAAEDSSGQDYLITADHCFSTDSASYIYGEGDAIGSWGYNRGGYIGQIGSDHPGWDAQTIIAYGYNGYGSNSDEADQPAGQWYAVTSASYSYNGDSVCQDGARSYYDGHGVPCGINVTNDDIYYNITWDDGTVITVRGVQGQNSNWTAEHGDSGGLVFTISGSSTRQARGIVSAGNNGNTMYWTEAPDILNSWNLHLNPHV